MEENEVKTPENIEEYQGYYSESGFWSVLKKVGAVAIRPALQLYYILKKDNLAIEKKLLIIGALGYLILPVDLIPDVLPVIGWTDDIAGMTGALKVLWDELDDNVNRQVDDTIQSLFGNVSDANIEQDKDHIDELNSILATQAHNVELEKAELENSKAQASSAINERHGHAAEYMRESEGRIQTTLAQSEMTHAEIDKCNEKGHKDLDDIFNAIDNL